MTYIIELRERAGGTWRRVGDRKFSTREDAAKHLVRLERFTWTVNAFRIVLLSPQESGMKFIKDNDDRLRLEEPIEKFYIIGDGWDTYRVVFRQDYTLAVDFEAQHIQGYKGNGVASYVNGEPVSLDKAEVLVKGHIKWDGCANFEFPDDAGRLHRCDRSGLTAIGTLLGRIFDQCAAIMKKTGVLLDGDVGQQPVVEDELPWETKK